MNTDKSQLPSDSTLPPTSETNLIKTDAYYRLHPYFFGDWYLPFLLRPGGLVTTAGLHGVVAIMAFIIGEPYGYRGIGIFCLFSSIVIWTLVILSTFGRRKRKAKCELTVDKHTGMIDLNDHTTATIHLIGKPQNSVLNWGQEILVYKAPGILFPVLKDSLPSEFQEILLAVGNNLKFSMTQLMISAFGLIYPVIVILVLNKLWLELITAQL